MNSLQCYPTDFQSFTSVRHIQCVKTMCSYLPPLEYLLVINSSRKCLCEKFLYKPVLCISPVGCSVLCQIRQQVSGAGAARDAGVRDFRL